MDRTGYLLRTYDLPVPRYTSYPTAPHFSPNFGCASYAKQLAKLPAGADLSLYVHFPFCKSLCWYCGCTMKVSRNVKAMSAYTAAVCREIATVASSLGRRRGVSHIHFGGGTPTWGPREGRAEVMHAIRTAFDVRDDAEIAIEIDPRTMSEGEAQELAGLGFNRASLGVQDFDPAVQEAINRIQSPALVARVADELRRAGITRLNLDLIYGLPLQTVESVRHTVDMAMALDPRRIALFGYAHVPWMKKHQSLLEVHPLPSAEERYALFEAARAGILARGFRQIGLDHFAHPADEMAVADAEQALHRNFQGYTTDTAPVLLGFGASAISALPGAYAQNDTGIESYKASINQGGLATARGRLLTRDDQRRRDLIMALMCRYEAEVPADLADAAAQALSPLVADGLCFWEEHTLKVPAEARPWVRVVASCFDAYHTPTPGRHARAV